MAGLVIKQPQGKIYQLSTGKMWLEWNAGFGPIWSERFTTTQQFLDSEIIKRSEKYTPKDTGLLIESTRLFSVIGEGKIIWGVPYAQYLYYGVRNGKPINFQGAPQRGAFWFERTKTIEGQAIIAAMKAYFKTRVQS